MIRHVIGVLFLGIISSHGLMASVSYLDNSEFVVNDSDFVYRSGQVGINTEFPQRAFDVSGNIRVSGNLEMVNTANSTITLQDTDNYKWVIGLAEQLDVTSNTLAFLNYNPDLNVEDSIFINASGNIGLGVTNPRQIVSVAGGTIEFGKITGGTPLGIDWDNDIGGGSNDDAKITYGVVSGEATELVFLVSDGTKDTIAINQGGATQILLATGNVYVRTSPNLSSDKRLKRDIEPLIGGVDIISKLNAVRFQWIKEMDKGTDIGVIAQDVIPILPSIVFRDSLTDTYYVEYMQLIPHLILALQEQQIMIDQLKSRVEAIKKDRQ